MFCIGSITILGQCKHKDPGHSSTRGFHCTALWCTHMWCTALYCTVLHCTVLHCTALHCTALHCTALQCTALHCTALHCTALHCTALHCTALHCTALNCPVLNCTTYFTVHSWTTLQGIALLISTAPLHWTDPTSLVLCCHMPTDDQVKRAQFDTPGWLIGDYLEV